MIYLRTSVGIEIRQDDLLISCLRSNLSAGVFTNYRRIRGYLQREREQVRHEIDAFFDEEKISRDNIVLGVPRKDVILRYLDLPKEVEDNLRQVMFYQIRSFEPTEEEKLYYDFVLLKNGNGDNKLHVLALMIRKSILDAHLQQMRELGVRPAGITAGSIALANMFLGTHANGRDKIYFLADLRPEGMELVVLRSGALVYARESARPADMPVRQMLMNEVEVAAGMIRLDPETGIDGIILAGDESENTVAELREEMPECELLGDRLRFEMAPGNKAYLSQASTSLGLAYTGLSRRVPLRLNLLPAEQRVRQKRWAYIPTAVLGLCILAAVFGLGFRQMIQERTFIRELDQEIKSLEEPANRVKKLRAQEQAQEERLAALEGILNRRDQNLEILRELTLLLPSDTFLSSYQNRDCTLQLRGDSPPSTAAELLGKLEKSPLLKEVTLTQSMFRNPQTGKNQFNYSAKCEK